MDLSSFLWLIGIAVTITLAMVGFMINAFSALSKKQSEDTKGLHAKIDHVKDTYVRRDDFGQFREETREQLGRIEAKLDQSIKLQKTH